MTEGKKILSQNISELSETYRFAVISIYMVSLAVMGIMWPGGITLECYLRILRTPGILITDFFEVGGVACALFNSGLMGMAALSLVYFSGVSISGPTIAAIFTVAGFSLFGKTPANVWPIILGVWICSRIARERFKSFILIAMFGTALGPVVSQVSFGLGLGYPAGIFAGICAGMVLPALASHVLHNHQGYNLYNMGFTCGFVGMFVAALFKSYDHQMSTTLIWRNHPEENALLTHIFLIYFLTLVLAGCIEWKKSVNLWKLPGTLPTDFVYHGGMTATFFNMGMVALMGLAYVSLVRSELNGPVLGGIFTMAGFAAFGKHVKNVWPLMLGVFIASMLTRLEPSSPGVVLAALFSTTLAPIAGGFGPLTGILAGMVHLVVVVHESSFHTGLNLYNNGFAGGLVGMLFIATIRWYQLMTKED